MKKNNPIQKKFKKTTQHENDYSYIQKLEILLLPGKKRGRPRRGEHAYKPGQPRPPDKIDSAAEGLLELSNTGNHLVDVLEMYT